MAEQLDDNIAIVCENVLFAEQATRQQLREQSEKVSKELDALSLEKLVELQLFVIPDRQLFLHAFVAIDFNLLFRKKALPSTDCEAAQQIDATEQTILDLHKAFMKDRTVPAVPFIDTMQPGEFQGAIRELRDYIRIQTELRGAENTVFDIASELTPAECIALAKHDFSPILNPDDTQHSVSLAVSLNFMDALELQRSEDIQRYDATLRELGHASLANMYVGWKPDVDK
jgi:hypothetical protein